MTDVAYQGEPGAYGEEAVLGWFGDDARPIGLPTFFAVCTAIEAGAVDAGVLPLENSLAGTVGDALDALARGRLQVIGEVLLPIRHQLLVLRGAPIDAVERVSSHWQALAQCERFLAEREWQIVPAADTAGAARELVERRDRAGAVIASARAAERYGLDVAAANVGDAEHNLTRFAVLAAAGTARELEPRGPLAPRAGIRETLVTFETGHRPGDLVRALSVLAAAGINLNRIESRPTGDGPWRYRFLAQVAGDAATEPLRAALDAMRDHTRSLRVLGSFDAAGEDA